MIFRVKNLTIPIKNGRKEMKPLKCIKNHLVYLYSNMHPKTLFWLKRIGVAGFLFFLVKGLIWLAIFYYIGTKAVD